MTPRTSRAAFRKFVEAYKLRRLDDEATTPEKSDKPEEPKSLVRRWLRPGQRRTYLRAYLDWLKPHRGAVGVVFALAIVAAALQMVEPLFMRFIVDRVLLAD